MTDTDQLKAALKRTKKKQPERAEDYLSTGSTLLNLAITGNPLWGFKKGHYYGLVGQSSSGKTFLARTCLAEAAINPAFADYDFIDDDIERGALMDFARFFGPKMAARVRPPRGTRAKPEYSVTIDDLYFHLDDAFKRGKPFIYICDSIDSLTSGYEQKKFQERKSAARKGTKAKGDYGDGKAKTNSSSLRALMGRLAETGSILLIINQTRDNIDAGMFGDKETRSGGRSLEFYATCELWGRVGARIKRRVRGKDRVIGVKARIRVKKNRIEGREWTVEVPIYRTYGIDDLGSLVNFLISEEHWKGDRDGVKVTAPEYEFEGKIEDLVRKIEEQGLEGDLKMLVKEVWDDIERECFVHRKSRYA